MKSAIGIGALLADGLGDTIRVSLTEDPEFELEPCRTLAQLGDEAVSEAAREKAPSSPSAILAETSVLSVLACGPSRPRRPYLTVLPISTRRP